MPMYLIIDDASFDHVVRMVSARFHYCKCIIFPLVKKILELVPETS